MKTQKFGLLSSIYQKETLCRVVGLFTRDGYSLKGLSTFFFKLQIRLKFWQAE